MSDELRLSEIDDRVNFEPLDVAGSGDHWCVAFIIAVAVFEKGSTIRVKIIIARFRIKKILQCQCRKSDSGGLGLWFGQGKMSRVLVL